MLPQRLGALEARLLMSLRRARTPAKPDSPSGTRGRALPAVAFVSRRAWCRESGPPRSREASGSNPWPPTRTNLQILSHGKRPEGKDRKPRMDTDGHGSGTGRPQGLLPIRVHSCSSVVVFGSSGRPARECGRAGQALPWKPAEGFDSKRVRSGDTANPPAGLWTTVPRTRNRSGERLDRFG